MSDENEGVTFLFLPPVHLRYVCDFSYVGRSMRSSPVKSTPENDLFLMCLSSSSLFASRKWRIFNPSFT